MARYLWAGLLILGLLMTACASDPVGLLPQTKDYLDATTDCGILAAFRGRATEAAASMKQADELSRAQAAQAAYDYAGQRMKQLNCP